MDDRNIRVGDLVTIDLPSRSRVVVVVRDKDKFVFNREIKFNWKIPGIVVSLDGAHDTSRTYTSTKIRGIIIAICGIFVIVPWCWDDKYLSVVSTGG